MRIKDVAERVGVSPRLLRYYEEQGLIRPSREANGYRSYDEGTVTRIGQIRELLGAGLTTEIIRQVLPCLAEAACSAYAEPEFLARVEVERDRLRARIATLTESLDAIDRYLDDVPTAPAA